MKNKKLIQDLFIHRIECKPLYLLSAIFTVAVMNMEFVTKGQSERLLSTLFEVFLSFHGWGVGESILVICLYFLYRYITVNYPFRADIACIAAIFAIFMVMGEGYSNGMGIGGFFENQLYFIKSCIILIGYGSIFYSFITILHERMQNMVLSNKDDNPTKSNFSYKIKISLFIFVCWLPYLIFLYPGTILYDTGTQLYQFFGYAPLTNDSPFLQTWLIGMFVRLGQFMGSASLGIFFYVLIQMCTFIGVLTYMANLFRHIGVSKKIRKFIVLIYALLPIFPLYAISIGKDINFGIMLLLLIIFLFEIVLSKEEFMKVKKNVIILFFTLLLICLFRNAGIVLVIGCFPIFRIVAKKYWKIICGIYLVILISMVLWSQCVLTSIGVVKESMSANLSIPLQQTGRYVLYYAPEISEEERNIINKVVDYYALAESYNPEISDPVKILFKQGATKDDMLAYSKVYFDQFMRHPLCYIDAIINKSYGYFYPNDKGREKPYVFVGLNNVDNLNSMGKFDFNSRFLTIVEKMRFILNATREIPLLSSMTSIGFYSWCTILFSFFVANGRDKKMFLVFIPVIFVLLGCIASPVNAYFRYGIPMVFSTPFLFVVASYNIKKRAIDS